MSESQRHPPKVLFLVKFVESGSMIIISSGFPKSASTLLFLYTEYLIDHPKPSRGQKLFRKYNTEGFTPHFGLLNSMWYVFASMFGPVVVKTHAGPTFFIRLLIKLRLAVAYYSVRDPRDAVLSAMDHGRKAREKGIQSDSDIAFASFKEWKDLYPAFRMHHERYERWKKFGKYLELRYEAVVLEPVAQLEKVVDHIHLSEKHAIIGATVAAFDSSKANTKNFNKGSAERFKSELGTDEIAVLENEMRDCIVSMGYLLTKQS